MKDYVVIGTIAKTHGLFGDVRIKPTTNVLEIFQKLKEVFMYDSSRNEVYEVQLQHIKRSGKTFLAKFVGIDDEKAAKQIVGLDLVVKVKSLPKLSSPDEYYYYELLDLNVYDQNGNFLGKICDIITTGSNEVIVVKNNQQEILLPMIHDYVIGFERQKRLVVRMPEWI